MNGSVSHLGMNAAGELMILKINPHATMVAASVSLNEG